MTLFQLSYLLLWILAIALIPISVILVYLLAQLESQHKREGSGYGNNLIGRQFPVFSAIDALSGATGPIRDYRDQIHVVLAVSADCTSCRSLVAELSSMRTSEISKVRLILLCMGDQERCKDAVANIDSVPVYIHEAKVDATADLWLAGFPAALVVDNAGMVVDARHPLSMKGVKAAISNAIVSDRYRGSVGVAPLGAGRKLTDAEVA